LAHSNLANRCLSHNVHYCSDIPKSVASIGILVIVTEASNACWGIEVGANEELPQSQNGRKR